MNIADDLVRSMFVCNHGIAKLHAAHNRKYKKSEKRYDRELLQNSGPSFHIKESISNFC